MEVDLALLVTPITSRHKYITVGRKVILKVTCEAPQFVLTQVKCLKELILNKTLAKYHSYMTAKSITNAYLCYSLYITLRNIDNDEVNLLTHQKLGQASNTPQVRVHLKDKYFAESSSVNVTKRYSFVTSVH